MVAALTDRLDDWPLSADELAGAAGRLGWYAWDAGEPASGWWFRLAVEDGESGRAFAVSAVSPVKFHDERYVAELASKKLNTSDELGTARTISDDMCSRAS